MTYKDANIFIFDEEKNRFVECGEILEIKTETEADPEEEQQRTRTLSASWDLTLETKITGHVLRIITGTESNNERRMHHEPMRRRKRGFYIFNVSSETWIWKSVSRRGHEIKPYTRYGRRGQNGNSN